MNKKEQKHIGQRPLLNEYDIDPFAEDTELKLPRGMPTLEMLKTEVALHGLPASDGEYLFHIWLQNGFRCRSGPIKNWKAGVRVWQLGGYFPSQKRNGAKLVDSVRERDAAVFERIKKERRGNQR